MYSFRGGKLPPEKNDHGFARQNIKDKDAKWIHSRWGLPPCDSSPAPVLHMLMRKKRAETLISQPKHYVDTYRWAALLGQSINLLAWFSRMSHLSINSTNTVPWIPPHPTIFCLMKNKQDITKTSGDFISLYTLVTFGFFLKKVAAPAPSLLQRSAVPS